MLNLQAHTAFPPTIQTIPRPARRVPVAAKGVVRGEGAPLRLEPGQHTHVRPIAVPPSHVPGAPPVPPNSFFRTPTPDFPKVLQVPAGQQASPEDWGKAARPFVDEALKTTPAVLVRGAPLYKPADYRAFLDGVGYEREEYVRSFIDRAMEDGLYDATANPNWYSLTPHNENVFYSKMPNKIIFSMVQPATQGGGETMLQTNEALTLSIGQDLVDHFNANGGIRYTRWYPTSDQKAERIVQLGATLKIATESGDDGMKKLMGLQLALAGKMPTWQGWVGSEDPRVARQHFEALDLQVRFDDEGGLIAWNVLPATQANQKGQQAWLNFADSDGIPPYFLVQYGNGKNIDPVVHWEVKQRLLSNCTALPLRQGDVIFFDNIHCQHGRTPFQGKRKLLVEMAK